MFSQFFGQYLLDNQKITAEQFSSCMKYIKDNRVKLGLIAENEGLLTRNQANELNYLEVLEIHRLEYDRDDVHYVQEFLLYLIGAAENMSIILRKATYTGQSVQLSALFIPANRTELS